MMQKLVRLHDMTRTRLEPDQMREFMCRSLALFHAEAGV